MFTYKGLRHEAVQNAIAIYMLAFTANCSQRGIAASLRHDTVLGCIDVAVQAFTVWYAHQDERAHPVPDFCEVMEEAFAEVLSVRIQQAVSAKNELHVELASSTQAIFDEVLPKDAEAYLYSEEHVLMPLVCLAIRVAIISYATGISDVAKFMQAVLTGTMKKLTQKVVLH